jgi:GAF domain-containing protein
MTAKSSRPRKPRASPTETALKRRAAGRRQSRSSALATPDQTDPTSVSPVEPDWVAELEALHRVSLSLTSSLELPVVLNELVKAVLRLMRGARDTHIFLYDGLSDLLTFAAAAGADGSRSEMISPPRPNGLTHRVARQGQALFVPNMREHPLYQKTSAEWTGAIAGLPLRIGERVVGVMNVSFAAPREFSPSDVRLLQLLADQAAIAIENSRLYAEVNDTLVREQRLNEVTRIISSTLDLKAVLPSVVRLAAELLGADAGLLALITPGGESLEIPYYFNLPEGLVSQPTPRGHGVAWQIVQSGESVLLAEYGAHPAALKAWMEAGIHAAVGVPVFAGDQTLGCLALFSLQPGQQFTVRDLALAESIGRQAGVAIQNARLFEAEHQRVRALTALHDISLDLSLQIDHNVLLQTILEQAVQRLDAQMGAIYFLTIDGKALELTTVYNIDAGYVGTRLKSGEGLSGQVALTGQPLIVDDYSNWEGRSPQFEAVLFRSILGAPIKWQSQVIGVLNIGADRRRRFTQFDVTLVGLFADQIAVAVYKSRLYAETQRQNWELARQLQELTVLNQLAAASAEATDEEALITRVTEIVGRALYPDNFGIMLVDKQTGLVRPHPSYHGRQTAIGVGSGIVGRVAATGLPWLISDSAEALEYVVSESHSQSQLCVPIKLGDRVVGVVNAERMQPHAFTIADQQILFTIASQLATAMEKLRSLAAERAAHEQSAALYQVARTLNASLDREQLLSLILEQLARVVEYDSASVMLLEGEVLIVVAHRGFRAVDQQARMLNIESLRHIRDAIEHRKPVVIPDTFNDPRWRHYPEAGYIRCWLGVPLLVQGRVIGLLNLDKEQAGFYSETQVQLAAAFSAQASIAIENSRLYSETLARVAELSQLYAAAQDIGASLEPKVVLEQLVQHLIKLLDATSGYINGFDPIRRELTVLAENWSANARAAERKSDLGRAYLLAEHPMAARVIDSRTVVNMLTTTPGLTPAEQAQFSDYEVQSILVVPIFSRGQVLGTAEIWESRWPRQFTASELRLAQTLSQQVAGVIESAQLYQALSAEKQRLELIYHLSQNLSQRLDPEQVYAAIHRATAALMPCEAFAIGLLDEAREEINLIYLVDRGVRSPAIRISMYRGLSGATVARRAPIRIDDTDLVTINPLDRVSFGGDDHVRAVLSAPIVLGDKVIGSISTQSYSPQAYSAEDEKALITLTYQAAVAIENARLYDEVQRRLADQMLLYECGQRLSLANDVFSTVEAVAQPILSRLRATDLCYFAYDEATDSIRFDYDTWTPEATDRERVSAIGEVVILSGLYPQIEAALRLRSPRLIRRGDPDLSPAEGELLENYDGRTILFVPLIVQERVLGCFEIWNSQSDRDYDENEIQLVVSIANQTATRLQNAQLLQEILRRADETLSLYEIGVAASSSLEWDEVLNRIYDQVGRVIEAPHFLVSAFDETTGELRADFYIENGKRRAFEPTVLGLDMTRPSPLHWIVANRAPLCLPDLWDPPAEFANLAREIRGNTRAYIGVPLLARGRVIGVLSLYHDRPGVYGGRESALLMTIANQSAAAIENSRLFKSTQRNAAELEIASYILRDLNETSDVVDSFPAFAEQFRALTDCHHSSLTLLAEVGRDAGRDADQVILDRQYSERGLESWQLLTDTGLAAEVLSGQLHRVPDLAIEAVLPFERALLSMGARSLLNLPLRVRDKVVGSLNLAWRQPVGYAPVNLTLLGQIAEALALALEKSRLLDETRRRDVILRALADISEQLLMPGNLDEVLPTVLAQLGQAVQVSRAYIFENRTADDRTLVANRIHEWTAENQRPWIGNLNIYDSSDTVAGDNRWQRLLAAGKPLAGLVRDFPLNEQTELRAQDILSILVMPIFSGEAWWGFLGFDDCLRERVWLTAEIEALKSVAGALGAAIARQRIEAAERRQRALNEALRDTAAALSSTLNFDDVLDRILANVGRVVPHDVADVMLLDADIARPVRWRGYAERGMDEWIRALRMPLAEYHTLQQMAETNRPVIVSDAWQDPQWRPWPESKWMRSYAGAPIYVKDQLIGFINLVSAMPGTFESGHIEGLQAFAQQAAVAIQNAQLYDELNTLYHSSSYLINPGGNVPDVARQIARTLSENFEFAHCAVLMVNDAETELQRIARVGALQQTTLTIIPLAGPGLITAAMAEGQLLYVPDVLADSRYVSHNPDTRSELVVPLRSGHKIIGVLDLQSSEPNGFDERTRRIVSLFADNATLALENAQLLERLDQARQAAESASRLKSEFLANTSHELRTPLTGIIGSLSMIVDRLCDKREEEQEFARIAYLASQRLLAIINDVLDIAKIEAGRMQIRPQPVELGALFQEIDELYRLQAHEKNIYLQIKPPLPQTPKVWADPDRLRQVLINLVGNAIKFTEQGSVTVEAAVVAVAGNDADTGEVAGYAIEILVKDTGIGIPLNKQDILFQPFVQADGSLTRRYGGTGLGLSISRRLTEMMGGALLLYSAGEGQGSEFRLRIPIYSDSPTAIAS